MACYSPWRAFEGPQGEGVANEWQSPSGKRLTLPCGRCMGCRLDRARDWGVRIQHEASLHVDNSFLTLTYSDANLPYNFSVSVRELQLFLKRLRKAISPARIRFYACGEYGEACGRPHYHLIIFGFGFPDKRIFKQTKSGALSYSSALLEAVWPFGHAQVGTVTRQSGAYVARYVLKKIGGPIADEHYTRLHPVTGQVCRVEPEFATMSTRPGLGAGWFTKFRGDCFPAGYLVYENRKVSVPHYYRDKLDEVNDALTIATLKERYAEFQEAHADDLSDERLAVRGELQAIKQAKFRRDLGEV